MMHFFPVGGEQNWNVIDESEGHQTVTGSKSLDIGKVTAEYNLFIFSTTTYFISEDTDFGFPFTVLVHLHWTAKQINSPQ